MSINAAYKPLFESFTFKNGTMLKNRIVMAPMTNFASNEDGTVSESELAYYARRANGAGMVVTACIYVSPNGKGFAGEFSGASDDMVPGLARLASTIKQNGAKAILQIFHGGRECPPGLVPNQDVVSASAVRSEQHDRALPRALRDEEIEAIIGHFGDTTRRAVEAGFDGVEIHGANGYLLQQFYSPQSNVREDRWGGSLEKRLSFPLAVVDEVKRAAAEHASGEFLVGYRFSPEEATEPGLTMEDTFKLLDALSEKELDYLHVSLNDFRSKPRRGADESKTRLEWIQERVGAQVPVIGVGAVVTPEHAVEALETGVPLVAIGRELIIEPDWVEKVASGKQSTIRKVIQRTDQDELVVPTPLWQAIVHSPGWFPVGD